MSPFRRFQHRPGDPQETRQRCQGFSHTNHECDHINNTQTDFLLLTNSN